MDVNSFCISVQTDLVMGAVDDAGHICQTGLMSRPLTPRMKKFANEMCLDWCASRAAVRAGYSRRSARQIGARLLARDDISEVIRRVIERRLERVEVRADDVLRELARIGMSSPLGLVDDDGRLLNISQLSPDAAASIASFEVGTDEEGKAKLSRVRLADKVGALSQLVKHLGLLAPTQHIHAMISLTPDQLSRCTDQQLERVEAATLELTTIQQELNEDEAKTSSRHRALPVSQAALVQSTPIK